MNELLTVEEALEILGIHRATLYLLVKRGQLTRYRIPGHRRVYFKRAEVEALKQPKPVYQPVEP